MEIIGIRKQDSLGYCVMLLHDPMFSHIDTI